MEDTALLMKQIYVLLAVQLVTIGLMLMGFLIIARKEGKVSDALQPITDAVNALVTAQQAEVTVLQELEAKLQQLGSQSTVDPAEVASLASTITAVRQNLEAAAQAAQQALNPPAPEPSPS